MKWKMLDQSKIGREIEGVPVQVDIQGTYLKSLTFNVGGKVFRVVVRDTYAQMDVFVPAPPEKRTVWVVNCTPPAGIPFVPEIFEMKYPADKRAEVLRNALAKDGDPGYDPAVTVTEEEREIAQD